MDVQSDRAGKSRAIAWLQLFGGLFALGISIPLMIRSGLGLGPWDAFHVGLHNQTGMTVGTASIVVGIVIIGASTRVGVRPGPGTIANMILVGVFIDLFLPIIPDAGGWLHGLGYYGAGIALVGLSTGMYMGAGLGNGPRDGLMVGLSRARGWSVRSVRTAIELSALAGGWLMGGAIGVGTVLFALLSGPATQYGLELFGVVPRRNSTGVTRPPPSTRRKAA